MKDVIDTRRLVRFRRHSLFYEQVGAIRYWVVILLDFELLKHNGQFLVIFGLIGFNDIRLFVIARKNLSRHANRLALARLAT